MLDDTTRKIIVRAHGHIPAGSMVFIAPRFKWLPYFFMRWSWFRVAKLAQKVDSQ